MPKSNITLKPKAQVITYVMCLNLFKTAKKHKKASYVIIMADRKVEE